MDNGEEREKIIREGSDAEFILSHAFVDGFLNIQANMAYVEFSNLDEKASHIECLKLICKAQAIRDFRTNLRNYITAKESLLINEQLDKELPEEP